MVRHLLTKTRWLVAIYLGAAVLLAPWILFLWLSQPSHGTEHNVGLLAGGLLIILALATVASGLLYFRLSPRAVVAAGFAGSFALATLWFRVTAQPTRASTGAESRAFATLLLPFALLLWSGFHWLRQRQTTRRTQLFLSIAYVTSAGLVTIGAIRLSSVAPTVEPEHHLRLVWTGLDIFELLGLAWTAWSITVASRLVVFAGTFTAALLVSDAWTNVISTTSDARLAAVGMAFIELSLASLSVGLALRATAPPAIARTDHDRGSDANTSQAE
jgi:hypothetical protein